MAALVAIASAAALIFIRPRRYGVAAFGLIFLIVLGWYFSLRPSNNREWAPDVAMLPWIEVHGNQIAVHNLRCFEYRSETDFTPTWRDQTFDLDQLQTLDAALCYWGSPALAHGIVSFGFSDGQYLAISIETRKEKFESYSAIEGFFRQYELIYVVADERDVLRLRTNYRNEDVFLYHTRITPQQARRTLLSYVDEINSLRDRPEWYNALTSNCITSVVPHMKAGRSAAHYTWRTFLSGYVAEQAYQNGQLDDSVLFERLQARSHINAAARAAPNDSHFSEVIRAGLPVPGNSR